MLHSTGLLVVPYCCCCSCLLIVHCRFTFSDVDPLRDLHLRSLFYIVVRYDHLHSLFPGPHCSDRYYVVVRRFPVVPHVVEFTLLHCSTIPVDIPIYTGVDDLRVVVDYRSLPHRYDCAPTFTYGIVVDLRYLRSLFDSLRLRPTVLVINY